jgi:ribosomal protein S18 acetylase RimI-like enzyme
MVMVECAEVQSGSELDEIRKLFLEYAESQNFNVCFESFNEELRRLPEEYAKLVLCRVDGKAAGCIALKRLQPGICEMKRLYVRPAFRGKQLGRKLVLHLIEEARRSGYAVMRLKTIPGAMDHAIALYRSIGFKDIAPYSDFIPEAIYLEFNVGPSQVFGSDPEF